MACEHRVCGCGNQPPWHCMYCCEDMTEEELRADYLRDPSDLHRAFDQFREEAHPNG